MAESEKSDPVTAKEVEESLSFAEKVEAAISPDDEYAAANLEINRRTLQAVQSMGQVTGGVVEDRENVGGALSAIDPSGLPEDAIGVTAEDINPDDFGPAVFQLQGSVFYARVENTDKEEMQAGEAIRITGDGNQATTDRATRSAANAGGAKLRGVFRYQGKLYGVPDVVEAGEAVKVANQKFEKDTYTDVDGTLDPGESQVFAKIEPPTDAFALLKYTNATAHDTVQYNYYIDDEQVKDPDLSGTVPWATPPDLHEIVPDGYRLVEDYAILELSETSGSTQYTNVQGTLTALIIEV